MHEEERKEADKNKENQFEGLSPEDQKKLSKLKRVMSLVNKPSMKPTVKAG